MWQFLKKLNAHLSYDSVILSSVARSHPTLCNPMDRNTSGFPAHHQLLEHAQTHVHLVVMPSNHLILCCPLLFLPSIFPSIRVFSTESVLCIRWPKYWSFSFRISPSYEYSGLISFRIDCFDLLAVQQTLSSVFSSITVGNHQFFGTQPSLWSNSQIRTWLLEKIVNRLARSRKFTVGVKADNAEILISSHYGGSWLQNYPFSSHRRLWMTTQPAIALLCYEYRRDRE